MIEKGVRWRYHIYLHIFMIIVVVMNVYVNFILNNYFFYYVKLQIHSNILPIIETREAAKEANPLL